jgi:hypothetical protein
MVSKVTVISEVMKIMLGPFQGYSSCGGPNNEIGRVKTGSWIYHNITPHENGVGLGSPRAHYHATLMLAFVYNSAFEMDGMQQYMERWRCAQARGKVHYKPREMALAMVSNM